MFKLIALDVDGTLLNSDHELTPTVAEAVIATRQRGIHIVLATGKQYTGIQQYIDPLGLTAPQITSHGAQITNPQTGAILHLEGIPIAAGTRALHIGAELSVTMVVAGAGKTFAAQHNQDIDYMLTFGDPIPQILDDLTQALTPPPTHLIALAYQQDDLYTAAYKRFSHELAGQLNVYRTSPYYVEFLHPRASKGNALLYVCEYLGIEREAVMAVGDSFNDLSMFAKAGLAVAMGNSHPDVKTQADRVIATNDADGVAQLLHEVLDELDS